MINEDFISDLVASDLIKSQTGYSDHEMAAALPDASLDCLLQICSVLNIKNIFEFGSGRSTEAFLRRGYSVTSLEDSSYWLEQTKATLRDLDRASHTDFVKPLVYKFLGMFPVMDWKIDKEIAEKLIKADLILIDSPYYTPFRESTLWSALHYSNRSLIVIDDTRISTLRRFCDRISDSNNSLIHARITIGHGFDIFYSKERKALRLNHSIQDVFKGWRRFFLGVLFYFRLSKMNHDSGQKEAFSGEKHL